MKSILIFIASTFAFNGVSQYSNRYYSLTTMLCSKVKYKDDIKSLNYSYSLPSLEFGIGTVLKSKSVDLNLGLSFGNFVTNSSYRFVIQSDSPIYDSSKSQKENIVSDKHSVYFQPFIRASIALEKTFSIGKRGIISHFGLNNSFFFIDEFGDNQINSVVDESSDKTLQLSSSMIQDTTKKELNFCFDFSLKSVLSQSERGVFLIGLTYNLGLKPRINGYYSFSNLGMENSYSGELYQKLSYLGFNLFFYPKKKEPKIKKIHSRVKIIHEF